MLENGVLSRKMQRYCSLAVVIHTSTRNSFLEDQFREAVHVPKRQVPKYSHRALTVLRVPNAKCQSIPAVPSPFRVCPNARCQSIPTTPSPFCVSQIQIRIRTAHAITPLDPKGLA